MKNIHVLSTDKPSRLQLQMNGNFHIENGQTVSLRSYQNIYITSDEEIKEGDWIYSFVDNKIYKIVYSKNNIIQSFYHSHYLNESKKIILTTDLELQKDGAQAIPDDFLEWFVKYPTCEYIEIENVYDKFLNGDKRSVSDFRKKYKIIIPKEEPIIKCELCKRYPRLEGTNKCESCYSVVRNFLEQDPKFKDKLLPDLRKRQETLEEAAENYQKNTTGIVLPKHTFIAGAMYSELQRLEALERLKYWEDECQRRSDLLFESYKNIAILTKIIEWYDEESDVRPDYRSPYLEEGELTMWEWFEQFKKK